MANTVTGSVTLDGRRRVLQTPRSFYWRRGATLALLVPVLLGVVTGLIGLLEALDTGSPGVATGLVAALCAGLAVLSALSGAVTAVRGPARSAASRVEIDVDDGVIVTPTARHPIAAVRGVELYKPNAIQKWHAIAALTAAPSTPSPNPYQPPADGRVILLRNIGELDLTDARKLLQTLAVDLGGVQAADRSSSLLGGGGLSGKGRGTLGYALAYIPIQGIFLIVSLGLILVRRDDPNAMFHARQSLALFALEIAAILGAIALTAPLLVFADDHPAAVLPMAIALLGITGVRLIVRFVAAWRAHRGEAWVVPGMGWLSRRWLPPTS